jgi:uncharacterized caspase-like protein
METAVSHEQNVNTRDYAVVVGIDHYPDYRCLRGATTDAKDFESWLLSPVGGGLPRENCKTILSPEFPTCPPQANHGPRNEERRRPIQDDIDDAFAAIWEQLKAGTGRRLYVYFSGHGLGRHTQGADLCLAKWEENFFRDAALASELYQEKIIASGRFPEMVLFLDCCRVRKVGAKGQDSQFNWPKAATNAGSVRTFVAFATEFQDVAREAMVSPADSGTGDRPLFRSYFTQALLNALRGGAARIEGGVPASALRKYLEDETPLLGGQKPQVLNALSEEAIFGGYLPGAKFRFQFRPERLGPIVLIGPDNREIERWCRPWNPVERSLTRWLHLLLDEATGEIKPLRPELGKEQNVEF